MKTEEASPEMLVRAKGFSYDEESLRIAHEEGEFHIPWHSIAHAFQVILDRKITAPLPLFIVHMATSDRFYYMDRNSPVIYSSETADETGQAGEQEQGKDSSRDDEKSDDAGAGKNEEPGLTLPEVEKQREELFLQAVTEMCRFIPHAAQHESLLSYLRGSRVFIHQFSAEEEILDYCIRMVSPKDGDSGQGEPHAPADELLKGKLIDGKYTILDIFATSSRTTYIVLDPDYQIFFTMKTLPALYARDASMTELFVRQARAWTLLESHENLENADLLKIIDGRPYVFTEFIQGRSLESILKKESLSVKSILQIGIQAAEGLHHAASTSPLIHRDLRLSHLFITEEQRVKITNPGMSAIFDDLLRRTPFTEHCRRAERGEITAGQIPLYKSLPCMAPELFYSPGNASLRSDIYPLGVILYTLLTSFNPFASSSPAKILSNHLTQVPPGPESLNPRVPPLLSALVMKCLEEDPAGRYSSFADISLTLRQIHEDIAGEAFNVPTIETEPGEDYWIHEGLTFKSCNRNREAQEAFEKALAINPGSLRARFYRGSPPSGPGEQEWQQWFWKGESLKKSGDTAQAEKCYDRALCLHESSEILWSRKARLLSEKGAREDALQCCDRALFWNPRAADVWDQKGSLLMKQKNHREALHCFSEALEFCPGHKWILHHLGMALFKLGSIAEASKTFQGVLELDPSFYSAWIWLGDCHNELENMTGALDAYESAIALQHTNLEAYLCSIGTLKEASLWEQALEYLDRALDIHPHDPDLALEHAEILLKLHYYADARALCEELLKERPDDDDVKLIYNAASRLHEEQAHLYQAIFAASAVPLKSVSSDLNNILTLFCSVKKAIAHLESLKDSDGPVCYLKGCLYYAEGDFEKANAAIAIALEDPAQREKAQRIKGRIDESMEKLGLLPPRKRDLFGFARNTKKNESPDELLVNGLERLRASDHQKARSFFRDSYTQNPSMLSCIYFMGLSLEQEGDLEKARHYYGEFGINAPLSIGFHVERTLSENDRAFREQEEVFHRLIGSYPHHIPLWIDYFLFLLAKKHDERLALIASFLLREPFSEWDYLKETPLYLNVTGFLNAFLGRYAEALESFRTVLQREDDNIPALLGTGACYEGAGRFEEAIEHFKGLLDREETYGIASYLLSHVFLEQKQPSKASNTIERPLEKFGGSLIMLFRKAQIHDHLKMYPGLEELYASIIEQEKRFSPIRVLQAKALCDRGNIQEGKNEMSTALSCNPGNVTILHNLAFIALQAGERESALSAFKEIQDACSLNPDAFVGPGIIYYRQKDFEKARDVFDRALELSTHEPDFWLLCGAARFHLGDQEGAHRCLESSIACRSRYTPGWLNLGVFHLYGGRLREAEECLERALAQSPHSLPALLSMAKCRWRLGNQQDALEFVLKAIALHCQDAQAWNLAGIFDYYRRNFGAGFNNFERAAGIAPGIPEPHFNRGLSALYLKKYDAAHNSLEKARALQPDRAETMIALCMLARTESDLAAHNVLLQHIQQKHPEKYTAWSADYQKSRDPLSYLKPVEIQGDPFTLPLVRPLSIIQPVSLFHLLDSAGLF